MLKLRKLLEDVHLESEETAHMLRKKHQEVVVDFQDQIDQLSKARARWVFSIKTLNDHFDELDSMHHYPQFYYSYPFNPPPHNITRSLVKTSRNQINAINIEGTWNTVSDIIALRAELRHISNER